MALPDRWVSWWVGAVPYGLSLIGKYQPDVIWSTFPIATAHLIAATLHRLTGIPWVADFRDPMVDTDPKTGTEFPLDPFVRRTNSRLERYAVQHCSYGVFTTPGTLKMYAERYPDIPLSRWKLIENGYDEENFACAEHAASARLSSNGRMVLLHSGALDPSIRDPRTFFDAVAELQQAGVISSKTLRVVLRASGNEEAYRQYIQKAAIGGIVSLEPPVPYREALREMLSADGLLIFQASNCNFQVPGKLYEYLRARRPILAMTDPEGDTADILKTAGIGTVVSLDSKEQIVSGLRSFLSQLNEGRATIAGDKDVSVHSRRFRTLELAKALDALVNGDR
jgi:glycosyltransferase involved in cell wall biosynthesis